MKHNFPFLAPDGVQISNLPLIARSSLVCASLIYHSNYFIFFLKISVSDFGCGPVTLQMFSFFIQLGTFYTNAYILHKYIDIFFSRTLTYLCINLSH